MTVLAKQFPGVDQQTVASFFHPIGMVVAAADDVETSLAAKAAGEFRIMMKGDASAAGLHSPPYAMMRDSGEFGMTERKDQMQIADVVAVNQMYRSLKVCQFLQHEGRNKIAAVNEKGNCLFIAQGYRGPQVGDVIMGIGKDGYAHGQPLSMGSEDGSNGREKGGVLFRVSH